MIFGKVPEEVITSPHLGDSPVRVYAALARHRNTKTGRCNPSQKALADMIHRDVRTIRRCLGELEKEGFLLIENRPGRETLYVLPHLEKAEETPDTSVLPTPDTSVLPTPDTSVRTPRTPVSAHPGHQCPTSPPHPPYKVGVETIDTGEAVAHPPTVREKLAQLCTTYPEIPRILQDHWLAHTELPASAQTSTAKLRIADTIRLLHTADGYDWPQIARIVEHAATVWHPQGMIGSPASLRDWTSKHDRKVHEAILAQLDHPASINPNGKPGSRTATYTPEQVQAIETMRQQRAQELAEQSRRDDELYAQFHAHDTATR